MVIGAIHPYTYVNTDMPIYRAAGVSGVSKANQVGRVGSQDSEIKKPGKVDPAECETCKNRKYVDGSDEMVSFKTPGHIDPSSSASVVLSHEREHVANAVSEGGKPGNELISASVSLKMAVCPECGTAYAAGGTTSTTMRYDENNPYEQARKTIEGSFLAGQNLDLIA